MRRPVHVSRKASFFGLPCIAMLRLRILAQFAGVRHGSGRWMGMAAFHLLQEDGAVKCAHTH